MNNSKVFFRNSLRIFVFFGFLYFMFPTCLFGQAFETPVQVNDFTQDSQDTDGRRTLAVDGDNIYTVWMDWHEPRNVYFSRSTDGGSTFESSIVVSSLADTFSNAWPSIAVNNSGEIFIAWSVLDSEMEIGYGIYMAKSTDNGASFSDAVQVTDQVGIYAVLGIYGNNVYVFYVNAENYPDGDYYFCRSTNGGTTFETPYQVNDAANQDTIEYDTMTDMYVDINGNIYVVWNDTRRPDGNGDIYFAKSTDNGVSFGTNVPVNDIYGDYADCEQIFPSIAVADNSTIYVAYRSKVWVDEYNDWREYVYIAKSTDSGNSFGPEMLVNESWDSNSDNPAVAVSPNGFVYICYPTIIDGQEAMTCKVSRDGGKSWYYNNLVSDLGHDCDYPALYVDEDENIYVLWSIEGVIDENEVYFTKGYLNALDNVAQDFSVNLMVNDIIVDDQDTDGSRTLAVYGNNIYTVWNNWDTGQLRFSRSTDGGKTGDPSISVSSLPADTYIQAFPSITVDGGGNIYVAWCVLSLDMSVGYGIYMAKSTDSGVSFSDAVQVDGESSFYPVLGTYGSDIYAFYVHSADYPFGDYYLAKSTDGGSSFGTPVKVNDEAMQDTLEYDCMTDMYVDDSGVIYCAWNDSRRAESDGDVYFAKSVDGGQTFSTNVNVNAIEGVAATDLNFDPSIAVSNDGTIYIVFRWERDESAGDIRIVLAKSTDGGESFGSYQRVNGSLESLCRTPSIGVTDYGYIYVAYPAMSSWFGHELFCAVSDNEGESFYKSTVVSYTNSFHATASYPSLVIGEDNMVNLLWGDRRYGDKSVFFAKGGVYALTGVESDETVVIPENFELMQNYPNPFNMETTIKFKIVEPCNVKLAIYNILGQEVCRLFEGRKNTGIHTLRWDGRNKYGNTVSSGMYIYRLMTSNGHNVSKKMILLK